MLLESLDDVRRSRAQAVARTKRLVDAEDIAPRILRAAAGIERWVEVQPSMFEDVIDEELTKYEKFREELEEGEQREEVLLASVKVRALTRSMLTTGRQSANRSATNTF